MGTGTRLGQQSLMLAMYQCGIGKTQISVPAPREMTYTLGGAQALNLREACPFLL